MVELIKWSDSHNITFDRPVVIYGIGDYAKQLLGIVTPSFFCYDPIPDKNFIESGSNRIQIISPGNITQVGKTFDVIVRVRNNRSIDSILLSLPSNLFDHNFDVRVFHELPNDLKHIEFKKKYNVFLNSAASNGAYTFPPEDSIRYINKMEFDALVEATTQPNGTSYYSDRWKYMSIVVDMLKNENDIQSVLEVGSYCHSIASGSDIVIKDKNEPTPINTIGKVYCFDATKTPWPVNKKYDLFIALQVWEHFDNAQVAAFNEVRRIARKAILSFPYLWDSRVSSHYMINYDRIKKWTCDIAPDKVLVIGDKKEKSKRMIWFWNFDDQAQGTFREIVI